MKMHKLTSEQARFIWTRGGNVYRMKLQVTKEILMPYTGADFIDGAEALAEKREINKFSRRSDYPTQEQTS